MAVKHKVIECPDEVRMNKIIRVLETIEEHKCLEGSERVKKCEKIVSHLGTITTSTTPNEYFPFMQHVAKIQEVLKKTLDDEEMIVATLRALYNEISNPLKRPTPMMSIVLQSKHVQYIPDAVKYILHSGHKESSLEQALSTLCDWLSKWTCTPYLGPLVLEFMRGLEAEQHYDILLEVTSKYIERLFKLVIIPEVRKSLGPVVLQMLSVMQRNPEDFQKIMPHVGQVLELLQMENTESSRAYLQNIYNLCVVSMEHFPDYALQPLDTTLEYRKTLIDSASPTEPIALSPVKVGLNNLGNTCYMNSVLQALFMTKPFRNDILLSKKDQNMLFSKLQVLFAMLQFSERSSLSPNDILSVARPPGFQPGHQHDSSEFLGYLLDVLHEQEGALHQSTSAGTSSTSDQSSASVLTIVKKSFGGGTTISLSQCNNCGSRSKRVDTFRDLQLSFPNTTENQSVQTLINYYLQPEKLCGDNQYHCDTCCGLTDGERVTTIREPPPRLVLTLKHFRYDPATQLRTKILQRVKLDNDIEIEHVHYKLYAAVVHRGSSVDSGHYYTYAKDGLDWYKFNDCFVVKSEPEELFGLRPPEAPYILFYSRIDCGDPDALTKCDLSGRLQTLLLKDSAEVEAEKKRPQINFNKNSLNKNDDPPPPGCGGGGFIDSSHNRYVY